MHEIDIIAKNGIFVVPYILCFSFVLAGTRDNDSWD